MRLSEARHTGVDVRLRCSHPGVKPTPHSQDTSTQEEVWQWGYLSTVSRLDRLRKGPGPPVVPGEGATSLCDTEENTSRMDARDRGSDYKCPQRQELSQERIGGRGMKRGCAQVPSPSPPGPRQASYITGRARRTAPATGGRSSPTSAGDSSRSGRAAADSVRTGWTPGLSVSGAGARTTPETDTQTP